MRTKLTLLIVMAGLFIGAVVVRVSAPPPRRSWTLHAGDMLEVDERPPRPTVQVYLHAGTRVDDAFNLIWEAQVRSRYTGERFGMGADVNPFWLAPLKYDINGDMSPLEALCAVIRQFNGVRLDLIRLPAAEPEDLPLRVPLLQPVRTEKTVFAFAVDASRRPPMWDWEVRILEDVHPVCGPFVTSPAPMGL
jgi:hypothetical protein